MLADRYGMFNAVTALETLTNRETRCYECHYTCHVCCRYLDLRLALLDVKSRICSRRVLLRVSDKNMAFEVI